MKMEFDRVVEAAKKAGFIIDRINPGAIVEMLYDFAVIVRQPLEKEIELLRYEVASLEQKIKEQSNGR